jgi:hypothetical protein
MLEHAFVNTSTSHEFSATKKTLGTPDLASEECRECQLFYDVQESCSCLTSPSFRFHFIAACGTAENPRSRGRLPTMHSPAATRLTTHAFFSIRVSVCSIDKLLFHTHHLVFFQLFYNDRNKANTTLPPKMQQG